MKCKKEVTISQPRPRTWQLFLPTCEHQLAALPAHRRARCVSQHALAWCQHAIFQRSVTDSVMFALRAWQPLQMETAPQGAREQGTLCGPGGSSSPSTFLFSGSWRKATKTGHQVRRERTRSLPLPFSISCAKDRTMPVFSLYQLNAHSLGGILRSACHRVRWVFEYCH